MCNKINLKKGLIELLVSTLIPVVGVLWLLDINGKYYFALVLGILCFLLFEYLSSESKDKSILRFPVSRLWIIISIAYFFCIISLWFIPYKETLVFVPWNYTSPLILLRATLSLLIGAFLPGYCISQLVIKTQNNVKIPLSVMLLLSFLLTALFCGSLSIVMLALNVQFGTFQSLLFITLLNTIILITYMTIQLRQEQKEGRAAGSNKAISFDLSHLILFSCALFVLLAVFIANLSHLPMLAGDQWSWNGFVSLMLNGILPSYPGKLFPYMGYPFFFIAYLPYLFEFAALPSANCYGLINIFAPIMVLGIYVALKAFFRDKRVPVVGAVFSLFAGLGWILAKGSPNSSIAALDIFVYPVYSVYWWAIPIGLFALPSFCAALYLVKSHCLNSKSRIVLLSSVLCLGYLMHILEAVIFIVFVGILLLLNEGLLEVSAKKFALSTTVALLTVVLLDVISPVKSYIFVTKFSVISPIIPSCIFFVVLIPLLSKRFSLFISKIGKSVAAHYDIVIWFTLSLYIFAFVTWLIAYHSEVGAISTDLASFRVPWYTWPIRTGLPGILALAFLISRNHAKRYKNYLVPFSVLFILSLLMSWLTRLFPVFSGVENLFSETAWIGLCVLAAVGFTEFISSRLQKRRLLASAMIGVTLIGGLGSTLLCIQRYAYNTENLTSAELQALNSLKSLVKNETSVLALSPESQEIISSFGNVLSQERTVPSAVTPLLEAKTPDSVFYILQQSGIKYIFVDKDDRVLLNSSDYEQSFVTWLVGILPIVFQNEEVTIYEVPELTSPIENATKAIVVPAEDPTNINYYVASLSLALTDNTFKSVAWNDLSSMRNVSNVVFTSDLLTSEDSQVVYNGNTTTGWSQNAGNVVSMSLLHANSPADMNSLAVTFNSAGGIEKLARVWLTLPDFWNLSDKSYVNVWLKANETGTADIAIMDSQGNWCRWLLPLSTEWTQLVLKTDSFAQQYGPPDLSKIKQIIVGMYSADVPVEIQIGSIFASDSPVIYPQSYLTSIIQFVETGGNLTILNQGVSGFFASLLSSPNDGYYVNVTSVPLEDGVNVEVRESEVGKGFIRYIDTKGFIEALEKLPQDTEFQLLASLSDLLEIGTSPPTHSEIPETPPYWGTSKSISLNGRVNITTESAMPLSASFLASKVDLSQTSFQGAALPTSLTYNVEVYLPEAYDSICVNLTANSLQMEGTGWGSYSIVTLENVTWSFGVHDFNISLMTGDEFRNLTISNGTITIESDELTFMLKSFSCTAVGESILNETYLAWPPYNIEATGGTLILNGPITFKPISTDGIILVGELTLDEATYNVVEPATEWTEENVTLQQLATAGFYTILAIISLAFIVNMATKEERNPDFDNLNTEALFQKITKGLRHS